MSREQKRKPYRGRVRRQRPGAFHINRKRAENKARGRKLIDSDE